MGKGKCENCKKEIDDKYKYCIDCNTKNSERIYQKSIAESLKNINWNLGLRNEFVKRQDPKLWAEIEKEWKEKKEKKEKEESKE